MKCQFGIYLLTKERILIWLEFSKNVFNDSLWLVYYGLNRKWQLEKYVLRTHQFIYSQGKKRKYVRKTSSKSLKQMICCHLGSECLLDMWCATRYLTIIWHPCRVLCAFTPACPIWALIIKILATTYIYCQNIHLFSYNSLCCGFQTNISNYRTRAIITRGLYTFYPLFKVHLCTVTFGLMYG